MNTKKFFTVVLPWLLFALGITCIAWVGFNSDAFDDFVNSPGVQPYAILLFIGFFFCMSAPAIVPLLVNWIDKKMKISKLKVVGVAGTGKIIEIKDSGITVNNSPYPIIKVEIGGVVTEFYCLVSRVSLPRVGDQIEMIYDPSNPQIALPKFLFK